jgi:hypothetical protein
MFEIQANTYRYALNKQRAYAHVLRNRNAYLNVFRIKIQTDTCRYALDA